MLTLAETGLDVVLRAADGASALAMEGERDATGVPTLVALSHHVLPSEQEVTFALRITPRVESGRIVLAVSERSPCRLPRFCPNRHINQGGTFCLGHPTPQLPRSSDAAFLWWALLRGYLELQIEAALLGEWDPSRQLPHGSDAADAQLRLERLRASLPREVRGAMAGSGVSPDATCPCGSRRRWASCHRATAQQMADAHDAVISGERDYWDDLVRAAEEGKVECCGTMKVCPLRAMLPVIFRARTTSLHGTLDLRWWLDRERGAPAIAGAPGSVAACRPPLATPCGSMPVTAAQEACSVRSNSETVTSRMGA